MKYCGYGYAHGAGKDTQHRPPYQGLTEPTLICPDCGTREALESIGVGTSEQEQILETIHRSQR